MSPVIGRNFNKLENLRLNLIKEILVMNIPGMVEKLLLKTFMKVVRG